MLASLALHALLLCALPLLERARKGSTVPMTARLVAAKPPEPALQKSEPIVPAPAPAAKAHREPVAKSVPRLSPAPAPAPVLSAEPAKPAAEPAAAPAAPVAHTPSTPAVPVARGDPPPPSAANGPDPGSIARFRLELMDIARRYKRYPRIAQDNNWEGRVERRLSIAENGALAALAVKKGAGRAVLDEEAQAMIRSAQAQATIPPALRGKFFTLEIPVEFFLRDQAR